MFSVSVITPVFNGARYLDALVKSVQCQNYPHLEHIVIDDGSRDNGATVSLLKEYPHLRWWSRENRGQYATMNEGLRVATGDIVCFISADDQMTPTAIWKAVNFLVSHKEFVGVYGNYSFIHSDGTKLHQISPMRHMPTAIYPYSLHIAHSSLYLLRNFLIAKNLYFDSTLRFVGDYEWIIRILRSGHKVGRIKDHLSLIRLHEHQASKASFHKMRQETQSVQRKLGVSLLWASMFRKIIFIIGLINLWKSKGPRSAIHLLSDRLKHHREKHENNSHQ